MVPSVSRVAMLPTTLQMAMLARAASLRLSKRGERVRRFARLRDDDGQGVLADDRAAVSIFGAVVDVDRDAGELLDHELADEARVPRRAARQNRDLVDRGQLLLGHFHLVEKHAARILRDAAKDRFARGRRLLEDFLEHEVLVAGLLRHDRVPEHALRDFGNRPIEEVGELHARPRDHGHFLVAEEDDVARVAEDRGDVRRHEELAVAESDDDRRAVSDGDDLFGIVCRDQNQREEPTHQVQRTPHRVFEPVVFGFAFDEMRDDFRVGFSDELVPLALQLVLQIEIVLDDPVVHDDNLAGAVPVRVGVLFGGPAMGGPARMPDAIFTADRMAVDDVFEAREFAGASTQLDLAVAYNGDAR